MPRFPSLARIAAVLTSLSLSFTLQAQTTATTMPQRMQVVVSGHKLPADSFGFYVQEVGNGATVLTSPGTPASTPWARSTTASCRAIC